MRLARGEDTATKIALVVDDSAIMRRIHRQNLEALGWQVEQVECGADALSALKAMNQCDLLLTDWHMPEMDGCELIQAIRGDPRYKALRIIMISSDTDSLSEDTAMEAGADGLLIKPFSSETFASQVQMIMASR